MAHLSQKKAAKDFTAKWKGRGYEKGESQPFWIELLQKVLQVEDPFSIISFENRVKLSNTSFIDAYIKPTHVLIEQKSIEKDLRSPIPQSDGTTLTPFRQAKRYAAELPYSDRPRWIVICNFREFHVYDMENPQGEPEVIFLKDLEKEYHRLSFLVNDSNAHIKKELEVSIQAGEIVGVLYEKLLAQYIHPENPDSQKSLNKLCVRLVFCLYAEDAGIFGTKNMFHDYLSRFSEVEFRKALIELFKVLDTSPEDRDPYMDDSLAAFPFVSGGMFAGDIEIPRITEEIRGLILQKASDDFDWSLISPTIFGAVFESTLNPETRRAGGMHYTSLENIHKVIDPLFLDDLKAELADIKAEKVIRTKKEKAQQFQDKLASLKFLDPACGSGNFLTESYTCLRRLENEAIKILYEDRVIGGFVDPVKVSIYQFFGIEINDFACSVSQAALWIAETQMLQETDEIVGYDIEPLPLKDYNNIHEGNALRMNWNDVVSASEVNYIMGNPPFVGFTYMGPEQKKDVDVLFPGIKNVDYVSCWFKKACDFTRGTTVESAFVSTNSICQGETVGRMWESLDVVINFAHKTFVWDSEANEKAHVHCIIVGFSHYLRPHRRLFENGISKECANINAYLIDAPSILIKSRNKPLFDVPPMIYGNKPADGGYLILTTEEKDDLVRQEPAAREWIHVLIGGTELINNKPLLNDKIRYCLWLEGISPAELRSLPMVLERVAGCKQARLNSPAAAIRRFAETPHLFAQRTQPDIAKLDSDGNPIVSDSVFDFKNLLVPRVSSERRQYVPMGYVGKDVVTNDQVQIIPACSLAYFGVLMSLVHMSWMRSVCGRLKSDYRYSKDIVYNNFPWPTPSDAQKEKIEQTAQAILDARALYPEASLADLYDELTMPSELRKAHRANDAAVMEAYGFRKDMTEPEIVAELFKMYKELTENK